MCKESFKKSIKRTNSVINITNNSETQTLKHKLYTTTITLSDKIVSKRKTEVQQVSERSRSGTLLP